MAKKQTRRSISVSGDSYNAVRDYCDEHGLSASGLVTDLLDKYLEDNAAGPPPDVKSAPVEEPPQEKRRAEEPAPADEARPMTPIKLSPPQLVRASNYPDRRGPGFTALPEGATLMNWRVTAQIDISRKRQIDAQTSVETLLLNLVHRRMVNLATILSVEQIDLD